MKPVFLFVFSLACSVPTKAPEPSNETNCSAEECVRLALHFEEKSDLPTAALAYERGCSLGSAHACGSLGMMRFYGHGISSQPAQGMKELVASCDADYGQACANLGIIYDLGRSGVVDKTKAKSFFKKGCRLQSSTACDALNK